ncbi:YigZ family protein [Corynebacterium argentoratense]|uniref:YigZ family protein n=1 Tax=Corynebacterium argentoratense TaxID=42817 RepID=UPI003C700EB7
MEDRYRRPADRLVTTEINIKRSRFITLLGRASSEDEAREFIRQARSRYPDARHHCSAFIIHVDGAMPIERSSDDGEPSGTAGNPMLDVLRGSGLLDVVAVVVRYFGGVKLGTGGLVRAYSDAVASALEAVEVTKRSRRLRGTLSVDHADAGRTEAELRAHGWDVVGADYTAKAHIHIAVTPDSRDRCDASVASMSAGRYQVDWSELDWIG